MVIAKFPLRLVRACVKYPQTRTEFRGNQFRTKSVIYGRIAPGWPMRAKVEFTPT